MKNRFLLLIILFLSIFAESKEINELPSMQKFDSLKAKAQESINTNQEIIYLDSMLNMAQAMDSLRLKCQTMSFLARNYYNRMNVDSLMYWANRAIDLSLKHEFYPSYFDAFSLVCSWELYEKDYDSALDKANRLYQMAKDLDNVDGMIASYETIGLIYMETFRYVEAVKSFKEGLSLQKQQVNPRYTYQFQFLSYIIESYLKLKDYKNVNDCLVEAYALVEECDLEQRNFPVERCLWLLNSYNAEMYVLQKMPKEAKIYMSEARKYDHVDDFYVFCYYHIVCSSYYMLIGDYHSALDNVDMVLAETDDDYLPALKLKAELLMRAGKEREAAALYYKSVNLIDSTYNESLSKQINQLRTIHEVDKLELKNKQIELEAGRLKLTVTLVFLVVLMIALIVVVIHSFYLKRMKKVLEKSDEDLKRDKEKLLISERALSSIIEKLETENRLKDDFLISLSHEINNSLKSIAGFSTELENFMVNEEYKKCVSNINESSELLKKIMDETICLSLLQTDRTPMAYENLEIIQFCRERVLEIESQLALGVTVNFRCSLDRFILQTDVARLKQVLDILLADAVKVTKEGEISLICLISHEMNVVQFIVESTELGISQNMYDMVKFESIDNNDSHTQGVNLRMAICNVLVNRLEGSLSIDTDYKQGTRVVLSHPIVNN